MLGNRSRFAVLLRQEIPNLKFSNRFLHRHALAAKTLPTDLRKTLEVSVKGVSMIRGRALNHQLFQLFCEEAGKEHTVRLYHTKVRWLSRGRVLFHLLKFWDQIRQFLHEEGHELAGYFDESKFTKALAYLADVFIPLNELNRSLQERGIII